MNDAKKNLLAEDNSILSLLFKLRLEKEGYKFLIAVNRKKATDLIEKHNFEFNSNYVMISFNNGLGVIRNVLKIISSGFFSSERLLESVLKNMGLNANHFIDNSVISTNQ